VPNLSHIRNASARRGVLAAAALVAVAVGAAVAVVLTSGGGPGPKPLTPTATQPPSATQPPPPAKPPPPAEQFGANTGRLFNDRSYSLAVVEAQLAALHATGATVARSDALWEASELVPPSDGVHHYDWAFDDLIAAALASNGLRWLPIIDYSAPWSQSVPGQDHSPPASPANYAAYAAAFAARYGDGGSFWRAHPQLQPLPVDTYEIWNEPDNPVFWSPRPDAAAYAALYLRARAAIDSAQPGARVIVGGLTHPASFAAAIVNAVPALRGQLDGVAIHPYGLTPETILANVHDARLGLDSLGLGSVPLYVTEFGWTTRPPGALDYLPERLRPGYLTRTLTDLGHLDCGIAAAMVYAWVTPERDPADPQDWFGIHPPDGGSSPDTAAFAQGLRAAASPAPTIHLCASG
jgi:hypothetical protein